MLFAVFILFPFFFGIWISLHDSTPLREGPFVGLRWYMQLFNPDSALFDRFWNTVWNTILFVLMSVPLLVGIGLLLATLLNTRVRGRNIFRARLLRALDAVRLRHQPRVVVDVQQQRRVHRPVLQGHARA